MDKSEFVSIINEHKKIIFKIRNAYSKNSIDCKDLEQEILLQLWRSFKNYDGRVQVSTWIYKVALNTSISFYRKERTQQKRRTRLDISKVSVFDTEYDFEKDIRLSMLNKLIENLNELDKALILLYLENKKQAEIAEIIGITETNVSTKISRIKKDLKKQFVNS